MSITAAKLAVLSGRRAHELSVHARALAPRMQEAGITTPPRIAAFVANVLQETDRLQTLEEYGDEAYFRTFLGDEWRFHGRGYLMNTWKPAYAALSKVLGVDLLKNPDRLERPYLAARAATWFWAEHDLNSYADAGDFRSLCAVINAGHPDALHINGYPERLAFYVRSLDVLREGTNPPVATSPRKRPNLQAPYGWYMQKHWTHHDWRPDVLALVLKYESWWPQVYLNTYFQHPPVYGRKWEFVSYDIWARAGRGVWIDKTLGWQIVYAILDDPAPPPIAWLLFDGWMWTSENGWEVYEPEEDGSDRQHRGHIHVSHKLYY